MRLNDGRVVPAFMSQALKNEDLTIFGDGQQTRSFCFVSDLVDGIFRMLMSDNEYEPVNIGNPVETTTQEFANEINNLVGNTAGILYKPGQRGEGDPQRRQPDIRRAQAVLGWTPAVNVEEGLLKTVPYFKTEMGLV